MKVYPIIAVLALLLASAFPLLANDAVSSQPSQPSQPLHRGGTTRR